MRNPVCEILIIMPLTEAQLMSLANGSTSAAGDIFNFLASEMDTTTLNRPQGYLVYLAYDRQLNLVPANSGAKQVENPNELEQLLTEEILMHNDGFLHIYVSNGSTDKEIIFDNFLITTARGKARQINHYYPYGLRISGLNGISEDYKNMYTSKELQTGEFNQEVSSGLEMPAPSGHAIHYTHASHQTCVTISGYDFHARFYDPQLGRWFTPDPAMQFSNPYLAMGNNPVSYVDPDGEFIFPALMFVGFITGMLGSGAIATQNGVHQSGREALFAGFKGAAMGAMVASGVAPVAKTVTVAGAKTTAATGAKTKVGSFLAKPVMKAGLKSGTINALSNYDYESGWSDFGLGTAADFGVGFAGAAFGVGAESKLAGAFVGGVLNTAVNTKKGDGVRSLFIAVPENWQKAKNLPQNLFGKGQRLLGNTASNPRPTTLPTPKRSTLIAESGTST
ncbi:MAG: hypothetical protein LC670_01825 [Flavobacteriales bacterium]|nr:hypothetical protein [Flavobacteriales bacterium]